MDRQTKMAEYRDVPGFPGYRVGDDGSVWSCQKPESLGKGGGFISSLTSEWKQKTLLISKHGYHRVVLCRDGKAFKKSVHQLVAIAFIGPIPDGCEVCHIDGRRTNNSLSNIRYGTRKENYADSVVHGTNSAGERHGMAKLSEEDVRNIRRGIDAGITQAMLSKLYGVSTSCVNCIAKGTTWKQIA